MYLKLSFGILGSIRVCLFIMAGEDGRGRRSRQTVAVILVLCSLVQSSVCFSRQGLSEITKQDEAVGEATVVEVKTGTSAESGVASADGLLLVDSGQSDGREMFEKTSPPEDMVNEAAWQRLNPTLHCGQKTMRIRAMGSGAADLQLDMGNAGPLRLTQVPETCGYSVKQTARGLVLVVPYDGCYVIQEDESYTLPMTWQETPVKFTCRLSTSSATSPPSITPKSPPEPFPFGSWSLNRRKRQANQPLPISDPRSPYYPYWYYYYMNMMTTPAPTPAAPTTTAKPETTTTTTTTTTTKEPGTTTAATKPSTEKPPVKPPVNPYYPYYLYYPYYPYYLFPQPPVTPATPATTTAQPTTAPATTGMTTTSEMTTTTSATTTSTTKTPPKQPPPFYPPYLPYYPHHPPPGKPLPQIPANSEIYYYPIIQHYYGKPSAMQSTPKPNNPSSEPATTASTSKPSDTSTSKPGDTATAKPSDTAPTTKPTTVETKPTDQTTKPSSNYPGPMSPFVPYYQGPFAPYVQYKSNKAGKIPYDPKFMPQAAFKSAPQPRSHLHPGFNYWQPEPWFLQSADQDNPLFDWKNFRPKEN